MEKQLTIRMPPFEQLKPRVCECGNAAFIEFKDCRELPQFYSPSGKMETMSKPTGYLCVACGKPMSLRPEPEVEKKIIASEG